MLALRKIENVATGESMSSNPAKATIADACTLQDPTTDRNLWSRSEVRHSCRAPRRTSLTPAVLVAQSAGRCEEMSKCDCSSAPRFDHWVWRHLRDSAARVSDGRFGEVSAGMSQTPPAAYQMASTFHYTADLP